MKNSRFAGVVGPDKEVDSAKRRETGFRCGNSSKVAQPKPMKQGGAHSLSPKSPAKGSPGAIGASKRGRRSLDWRFQKYGRISGSDIERCLGLFCEVWRERSEWQTGDPDEAKWFESVQKIMQVPNWTVFYQDSLVVLLAKIAYVSGLADTISKAGEAEDPAAFLLDSLDSIPDEAPDHPAAVPMAFAMIGNLDAIARYSMSINDMVEACKQGDLNSLFLALSVDSLISTMPFFQAALRLGQLSGDSSFAGEIFKAIKGPHKKRLEYPQLRWTEYLLRDQGAFEACSKQEIYELVVEHLRIYDPMGTKADAKAALFKLFRTWQKEAGIKNPRFGFSAKKR